MQQLKSGATVDLTVIKKFTQQHLDFSNKISNPKLQPIIKETESHIYGNKLPKGVRWVDRKIINLSDIQWDFSSKTSQKVRASGNPRYREIQQDINEYGWKLKNIPPAVFVLPDGQYEPGDGRTRVDIIDNLNVENCIFDIFESENTLSRGIFGLKANSGHDPAGDLQKEDVVNYFIEAIGKGIDGLNEDDDNLREIVLEKVIDACGEGRFTESQRYVMTDRIISQLGKDTGIRYWPQANLPRQWLVKNNYIETDEIVYMTTSTELASKALISAAEFHNKTGKKVRVCPHTGILTGVNPEECFVNRCEKFVREWDRKLSDMRQGFFRGQTLDTETITLFGFLPAVKALHPEHYYKKLIHPSDVRPKFYKTQDEILASRLFGGE
mgnify:CR=1 FL=1|tara:strand:+ start:196 stop:1344 length:1149 start_codon:yes stop_codon:yes gene_type:complete